MHWCPNETMALLAMIPVVGYILRKIQVWYHSKFHKQLPCACEPCEECKEEEVSLAHKTGVH